MLSDSDRATVTSAVISLYGDRRIRLWVVYVDNFSGQSAESWARQTYKISDLGNYDALLAVATTAAPTPSWCRMGCRASAPVRSTTCGTTRSNPR